MDFADEILDLMSRSGKTFQREDCSDITLLRENPGNLCLIVVPVKETTIEDAERKQAEVRKIWGETCCRTIIVPQDRWMSQRKAMEGRLLTQCEVFSHVFARNCEVRRIEKSVARSFLTDNHSYGDAACKYRYGMYVERYSGKETFDNPLGTLVAVSEFSNARRWDKNGTVIRSYEWIRSASLAGVRVVGGMSKMLSTFIDEVHPDDVMSYADLEWSDGDVYRKIGFVEDGKKDGVTFRIDPQKWTRTALGKADEQDGKDCGLTEDDRCRSWYYYKNMGSLKYRLKLTEY
jgi:hypothetical protein